MPAHRGDGSSVLSLRMVQRFVDSQVDTADFVGAFDLASGGCVSLIGAGGKTTTMLALAQAALQQGLRPVVTTTTRIWPPSSTAIHLVGDGDAAIRTVREDGGALSTMVLGRSLTAEGKVAGVSVDVVCALVESESCDLILCEADGAAGRPLKVHGPGEPVVPACSTCVVIVAGMDAVGRSADPETVHRFERFAELLPGQTDRTLTPPVVAATLYAATQYVPAGAHPIFLLNKLDDDAMVDAAAAVSEEILKVVRGACILGTSHGRLIEIPIARTRPEFRPGCS